VQIARLRSPLWQRGITVLVALLVSGCALLPEPQTDRPQGVLQNLRRDANTDLYARADAVREFVFPADHGPHDEFQTEWWYYTGNVKTAAGREFGYQFTIFRRAVVPPGVLSGTLTAPSEFAFTQIYFGHFAVTDVARDQHTEADRYSRAAAGLAGAQASPFKAFVEDWVVEGEPETRSRITARNGDIAIALDLVNTKPVVLQGDRGLSQKSPVKGNASYYYSMPRLQTTGVISTAEGAFEVTGESWLDREWSTSVLDENTMGWDWFALQLSDRREIMFYQLRQRDGSSATSSKGALIEADGSTRLLNREDFQFTAINSWHSPRTGVTYPMDWDIRIPSLEMTLRARAKVREQEMNLGTLYWEGAVALTGQVRGEALTGNGYVELTGYGDAPAADAAVPASR
jgi:predicted secreted hydrolase